MDFTLHPDLEQKVSNDELYAAFNEVFEAIKEAANIDLSIPEDSKEKHESGGIKFFIDYVGPLGGRGDLIKTDILKGEKLEFEVEQLNLLNRYSDLADEDDSNRPMLWIERDCYRKDGCPDGEDHTERFV